MFNYLSDNKLYIVLLFIYIIFSILLFTIIMDYNIGDSPIHANFLNIYLQHHSLPCNFLYYLLIWCISLLFTLSTFKASIVVLSIIHVFKFIISRKLALYFHSEHFQSNIHKNIFELGFFLLMFTFSLWPLGLNESVYLGTIPPNTWHNSTSLLMIPFAIALLIYSDKYLEKFNWKLLPILLIFCIFNLAAKPSFFHVFILIFPFFILWKYKLTYITWLVGGVLIVSLFFAIFQYWWLKNDTVLENYIYNGIEKSSISIQPFAVWRCWTTNFLLAIFRSIAYPIVFAVFYFRKAYINRLGLWIVSIFIISLLFFILLVETGPRFSHGNFLWQSIFASFLLFIFTFSKHIKELSERSFSLKWFDFLIIIFFLLHVASGIAYLVQMILTRNIF